MLRIYPTNAIQDALRSIASSAMAFVLLLAVAAPIVLNGHASAAQVTNRKITLSSSVVGATSVTYATSFRVTQTTVIRGLVVEICQNSPLIGQACTTTNGVAATPTSGTVTFTNSGGSGDATFEVDAVKSTSSGRLILTDSDGATGGDGFTPVTGADFTFSFTATNPSGTIATPGDPGTFYARILTYSTAADASNYVSATPGSNILDSGGVALSTARQLTVNARVQEELEFCVGTVDNTVVDGSSFATYNGATNCTGSAFSSSSPAVDLGVVSSTGVSISPVAATSGGNALAGVVLIRTNAFNGATITYFAEQNSGSGRLKVAGAACDNTGAGSLWDTGSNLTDQCFGSNSTQSSFVTSSNGQQEEFGMTGAYKLDSGTLGTTANLTRDTSYDGNGTAASGFAWDQSGTAAALASSEASSTKVLDYEGVALYFAARTAATTPTGTYSVTSTYVATSVF